VVGELGHEAIEGSNASPRPSRAAGLAEPRAVRSTGGLPGARMLPADSITGGEVGIATGAPEPPGAEPRKRARLRWGASRLPERLRDPFALALVLVGGIVALGLTVWVVVAVLVPTVEEAPCLGVTFRAPVEPTPGTTPSRPPIGGSGGFAGRVRTLFTGQGPVVYCHDFADPFVLRDGDSYYAYSTNTGSDHVPVLTAGGLFGTARRHDVLPQLPAWSSPGFVWAPALLKRADGYILYYTTQDTSSGAECISYARGTSPGGPFADHSSAPLICPPGGGAIDPTPFVDADGTVYLLWKNYVGKTSDNPQTGIMAQQLSPDGLTLVGPTGLLAQADQAWEAGIVEAPTMLAADGHYYLFYSGNDWDTANYAISFAVCTSPLGPCVKPNAGPWLTSSPTAQGPGSPSVFTDDTGNTWLALHSWVRGRVGYPQGARNLFVVRFAIVNGMPVLT
jgi:Glycosyl hydrolases family 43